MKKATLSTIYSALLDSGYESTDPIMEEISAELNRNAEVKQAKDAMYAQAKDVVLTAMDAPATITEIFEAVEGDLPEGFTKGNLQYAITRLWKDEIDKTEGKVNTYSRKA